MRSLGPSSSNRRGRRFAGSFAAAVCSRVLERLRSGVGSKSLQVPWFSVQPCASNKSHLQSFLPRLKYEVKMTLKHKSVNVQKRWL